MKITDVSIDNRVSVFILAAIITIIGIVSYISLPREAAPDVQVPLVIVSAPYFGASPEDIESLITQPIEKEINAISDVKKITSSSAEGFSVIKVEFESGYNIDDALQKVREKIDKATPNLPADLEKPTITEINFSEFPIMTYNISGPVGLVKLKDIADDNAILLLWVTFPKLDWSFDIMKAWGFEYRTNAFTWIKTNHENKQPFWGMGYYTRSNAEICLLGRRGKGMQAKSHSIHSVIFHPIMEHSRKPPIIREKIVELFGDISRIELFARKKNSLFEHKDWQGWDVWGDEVESDIKL